MRLKLESARNIFANLKSSIRSSFDIPENPKLRFVGVILIFTLLVLIFLELIYISKDFNKTKGGIKTYSIDNLTRERIYVFKPGEKIIGKRVPKTITTVIFSPKIEDKSKLKFTKSGKYVYKIPDNTKLGNYRLSILFQDLKGEMVKLRTYKIKIVANTPVDTLNKSVTNFINSVKKKLLFKKVHAQGELNENAEGCLWEPKDPECEWSSQKVYDVYQNSCSGRFKKENYHFQDGVCGYNQNQSSSSTGNASTSLCPQPYFQCGGTSGLEDKNKTTLFKVTPQCQEGESSPKSWENSIEEENSEQCKTTDSEESESSTAGSPPYIDPSNSAGINQPSGALYSKLLSGGENVDESKNLSCIKSEDKSKHIMYECSTPDGNGSDKYRICYEDYWQYDQTDRDKNKPPVCLFEQSENDTERFHCDYFDNFSDIPEGHECRNILEIKNQHRITPGLVGSELRSQGICGQNGPESLQIPYYCENGFRRYWQYSRTPGSECVWKRGRYNNEQQISREVVVRPDSQFSCGLTKEALSKGDQGSQNWFDRGFKDQFGEEYPIVLAHYHRLGAFPAVDIHADPDPETGKKDIIFYSKQAYQDEFCSGDEDNCITRFASYDLNDWEEFLVQNPDEFQPIIQSLAGQCYSAQSAKEALKTIIERLQKEGFLVSDINQVFTAYRYNFMLFDCAPDQVRNTLSDKKLLDIILPIEIAAYYRNSGFRELLAFFPFLDLQGLYDLISDDNPYLSESDKRFITAGILFDIGTGPLGKLKSLGEAVLRRINLNEYRRMGEAILAVANNTELRQVSRSVVRYYINNTPDAAKYVNKLRAAVKLFTHSENTESVQDEFVEYFEDVLFKAINSSRFNSDKATLNKALEDLYSIAADGSLRGSRLLGKYPESGNFFQNFLSRRQRLMDFYLIDPDLADLIVKEEVVGIHGSSSGSLLSVLHNGLMPLTKLRAESELVASGERLYANELMNSTVSFFEWWRYKLLNNYAASKPQITTEYLEQRIKGWKQALIDDPANVDNPAIERMIGDLERVKWFLEYNPRNDLQRLHQRLIGENFPLAYMANGSGIDSSRFGKPLVGVRGEFFVKEGVAKDNVRAIFVPGEKIDSVKGYIQDLGLEIKVFNLDYLLDTRNMAHSIPQVVEVTSNITLSNLKKQFGEFLGEGGLGRTFVNRDEGTVTKIFKTGYLSGTPMDNFNLLQNELYKTHGGKAGIPTYKYEVRDKWGNVIGFGQEFISNALELEEFLRRGNRLTVEEINDGLAQLQELHKVVGLPHGDVAYFDHLNTGNILIQTIFDENGNITARKIRFIDHFGNYYDIFSQNPYQLRDVMKNELQNFRNFMLKEAWDGRGDPAPKRRETVRL